MERVPCVGSQLAFTVGRSLVFALLSAVAVTGSRAYAQTPLNFGASPTRVGAGARALGKGNAFIAVADDATAASWNPAGLAQLEHPEISFAWESVDGRSDLDVADHPESSTTRSVSLSDLNYLSLAMPLEIGRHMVLSLNYLAQYRFDHKFQWQRTRPSGSPMFTRVEENEWYRQEGGLYSLSPALAVDVTPRLSLGLALNIWNDDITGRSSFEDTYRGRIVQVTALPGIVPDQVDNLRTVSESEVDSGYSLVLGGIYRASAEWAFGAVVKPAYDVDVSRGEVHDINGVPSREQHDDVLRFPWELGLGVAWRPTEEWTISSDITWTQWSHYELDDGELQYDVNPLNRSPISSGRCKDAVGCRLGAEYLVIGQDWVAPLRCGLGYDPAPAVDSIDDYYTMSMGAGFQYGRFMLDIAYELRWGNDVTGTGIGLNSLEKKEDVLRHRVVLSLIVYL